jgi:hypothetical protein
MRILATILGISAIGCGLSGSVSAGPQDYCVAYAREVANDKTGVVGGGPMGTLAGDAGNPAAPVTPSTANHAIDEERWHGDYNKAFGACMENYEPQVLEEASVQPAASEASKPKLAKRASGKKASGSSTRSGKGKQRSNSKKQKTTSRVQPPQKSKPSIELPAKNDASLCRRLQVDSSGTYHIRNCDRPRRKKG